MHRSTRSMRSAAVAGVILWALFVGGSALWSFYLCKDASYNCPASGCDDVPRHNCQSGFTIAGYAILVGTPLLVVAMVALALSRRRDVSRFRGRSSGVNHGPF